MQQLYQKNQAEFAKLAKLIAEASHILLATHENPDADAIGAVYALGHIAKHAQKPASIFLPDGVPIELGFLPTQAAQHAVAENLPGDLLIAVDYGDFPRTKLHEYVAVNPLRIATIDHHLPRDHRGEVIILDTTASSTCELVYHFCMHAQIPLTRDIATCLLAGIVFDTGGLQHSSTSPQTMKIVSDLMRQGARMHKVSRVIQAGGEEKTLRLVARALSRINYDTELSMSYTVVHYQELAEAGEDPDVGIVKYLLGTGREQKFSAFFRENEPQKFNVSLRSENFKGVNVSAIAKHFGGGGHMYASGCQIEGDYENALRRLKDAARSVLFAPAVVTEKEHGTIKV